MMKFFYSLLLLVLFVPFANGQKLFSPQELQEDFDHMLEALRDQHQGLYQYVSRGEVDQAMEAIRSSIVEPMTRAAFFELILKAVELTNEGHTGASLPKGTMARVGLDKSFLPVTLKSCDRQLIITQYFGGKQIDLQKGDRLVSVNGEPIEDIIERLLPLIVTDGFNETSRWEWIGSATFSQLYRLIYGPFKSFTIGVQRYEERNIRTLEIPAIRFTRFKQRNAQFAPKVFDYKRFTFKVIDDTIAYLSVTGFGNDDLDYANFYRSSFQRIKEQNIRHLVLDIQDNGGGTEGNENLLFSYVYPDVVQKYKRVTMLSGPYEKNKEDSDYILDKWAPQRGFAERGEYTLFSDYYSTLGYQKPEEGLVYDGMIYALISGITFSGGAEFSSMLRMTNRAIFIGEETGGTYEGNVSGYSETTQLPNSKIAIDIPTVHFQMNVEPILPGRGVLPDYEVHQTWADYMETRNAKLDFALELIRQ